MAITTEKKYLLLLCGYNVPPQEDHVNYFGSWVKGSECPLQILLPKSCFSPFYEIFLDLNWVLLTQIAQKSDTFDDAVESLVQMKCEHPEMYDTVLKFLGTNQHSDDFTTVMKKLKKKLKSEESLPPRPYFSSKLLVPIVQIDYRLFDGTQSTTTLTLPSICK